METAELLVGVVDWGPTEFEECSKEPVADTVVVLEGVGADQQACGWT